MIRNMDTDPNGLLIRYKWGGLYERRSDGKVTYYGDGNAYMGTVRTYLAVPVGNIVISAQARQIAVLQAQIQTMQQSGDDSDA